MWNFNPLKVEMPRILENNLYITAYYAWTMTFMMKFDTYGL